jgi:hypothetical protein
MKNIKSTTILNNLSCFLILFNYIFFRLFYERDFLKYLFLIKGHLLIYCSNDFIDLCLFNHTDLL